MKRSDLPFTVSFLAPYAIRKVSPSEVHGCMLIQRGFQTSFMLGLDSLGHSVEDLLGRSLRKDENSTLVLI